MNNSYSYTATKQLGLRRLRGLDLGVFVLLPAGVRTELGLLDPAEALIADLAVVPMPLPKRVHGGGYLAAFHGRIKACLRSCVNYGT